MVNWKSLGAKDRLLAALVAAHPDKKLLDYRRIATYYGEGTTYDSIEGQFRIIRRAAQELREAVESGEHEQAPPRGGATPKAMATPKAKITKSQPNTSTKKVKKTIPKATANGVINGHVTKSTSPPTQRKPVAAGPMVVDENNRMLGFGEDFASNGSSVVGIEEDEFMDFADLEAFTSTDWSEPFAM